MRFNSASSTAQNPMPSQRPPLTSPARQEGQTGQCYRTGAVARMVRMPVATLRNWERRYALTPPPGSASGHRLYSAADVQRVALLRQLTALGHAIGAIASLGMDDLQQVATTHARTAAGRRGTAGTGPQVPLSLAGAAADAALAAAGTPTPRRYDDATLADFAGLSSTIACECPQHVAALLMQLTHFEAYSAECAQRSPSDAQLHQYLQRVAGACRAHFEAALERVAIHEGLVLPP
jgi:DNA-binding transcriptional MerR regulator